MTVTTVTSVAAGAVQRSLSTSKSNITQSVKSLLSSSAPATTGTANMSAALSLQSQVAGLRAASLNIAQTSSMVSTAQNGASTISRILGRLQDLATRASGVVDAQTRRGLDAEFQSLRNEINRTVATINFNGRLLLDGSVTAEDLGLETDDPNAGLPDLSASALLGADSLSIATPEETARALEAIQAAQTQVSSAEADIGAFAGALEMGLATIESAINNQDAARSELSDADLIAASSQSAQAQVQNSAALSLLAQTNRMPANIAALLAE